MKRLTALFLTVILLAGCAAFGAKAESGVLVKTYGELLEAVNQKKADRILISSKYQQKGDIAKNLMISGRTVTLLPEKGERMTITARFDVMGEGNLILENLDIVGVQGNCALWAGEGAHVTAGTLTGGKAKGNNGNPAAIIVDASLTADRAVGSDGTGGMGGDGIYTFGSSTVEVREAVGGKAPKGVGGAGAVAFGGAEITVSGSATGGDGLYAAGKGALAGLNGKISGEGTLTDGQKLESKKPVDPTDITNLALLENAIRSGQTEIHLSPKFKSGDQSVTDLFQYAATDETVRIIGNPGGKHTAADFGWNVYTGSWELQGIDFAAPAKRNLPCIWAIGDAKITVSGNVTSKVKNMPCITVQGQAQVTVNGNCTGAGVVCLARENGSIVLTGQAEGKGQTFGALETGDNGKIQITGNVLVNGEGNAMANFGGTIEVNGDAIAKKSKNYPAVYSTAGETSITGSVSSEGETNGIYSTGGKITIGGNLDCKAKKNYAVYMREGSEEVNIHGNLNALSIAARVEGGTLTVDGDLTIRNKAASSLFSTHGDGKVVVNGRMNRIKP